MGWIVLGILWGMLSFVSEEMWWGILIAFGSVVVGIYEVSLDFESPSSKKMRFYQECKRRGIKNLSSPENKQRAELIYKEVYKIYSVNSATVEKAFLKGEKAYTELKEKEEKEEVLKKEQNEREQMERLKTREKEIYNDYIKYAEFYGREKRIAILKDLQKVCQSKIEEKKKAEKNLRDLDIALYSASQRKENDWATMGGIASGIAGPAAGLAVAMEAQAENAKIREENKINGEKMIGMIAQHGSIYSALNGNIQELEAQAKALSRDIDDAKYKLVSDESAEEVFNYVKIKATNVKISETGAFIIKATASAEENKIKVFDKTEGVIDGTIAADLYQENKLVGTALLVLPFEGLKSSCKFEGMGLQGAKQNVPHKIKFRPYKLWIMEK